MTELTIFTPTYNRSDTLKRLYDSLVLTKSKLKWLVIDDGSKDNTKEVMAKFIKENKLDIEYIYKENGGKMSAFNMAIEKCQTPYFMTIDSDDMIYPTFLKALAKDLKYFKDEKLIGLVYLTANMNKPEEIIGTKFPEEVKSKFYDIYNKYKVTGDKCIVWKSSLLKEFAYPLIPGEKFIPDAYLMNEASFKYDFMMINKIATLVEYQSNGYSANYFNLVKNNPQGNMRYFKQLYQIKKSWYNVYGYLLFGIYSHTKIGTLLKEHPAKVKVILLYLPTLVISKFK